MSGRPPTITGSGKNKDYEKRWNNWTRPLRKATEEVNRKLLMKAFEVALKLVMNNHIFTFNDENFKQLNGGAIGVSIAGDVANLFMVWWDRELKLRLQTEKITLQLYSRYVDDGNIVVQRPVELLDNTNEEAEKIIMGSVKRIANSIHDSIVVKVDFPSLHTNHRLPILDTDMWIQEVEVNGVKKHQILYSYYEKEMASKYLIHSNSALPQKSKMNILVNELLRVMRTTSLRVDETQKIKNVQHFINKMQFSGYDQEDKVHVYKKAKKTFTEDVNDSQVYPHKDKDTRQKENTREKIHQKKTWFSKQGKYKSVFYVDATPNSLLAEKCQKILNKYDVRIKVMEKPGESIKSLLTKSNPFKKKGCGDNNCPICIRDCGINYCEHYDLCNGKYDGETGEAIKARFGEHLDEYRLRPQKSVMHAHSLEHHNGTKVDFKVKVLGTCVGDPMLRQCMEAVAIRDDEPSMNRKEEWGSTKTKGKPTKKKSYTQLHHQYLKSRNQKPRKNNSSPKGKKSDDVTANSVIEQVATNDDITCWKCKLIYKTNKGLKIHQHACLKKAATGASFFTDERFELNRENKDRKRRGMKILPQSQPLEPLTSEGNQSNVKSKRGQCNT